MKKFQQGWRDCQPKGTTLDVVKTIAYGIAILVGLYGLAVLQQLSHCNY